MVKKTKWGEIMIGENIKRARLKQGVSQEEIAVRLHVVRQTVSKWENGRSVPDAEMLIQIADFLDVPVNQLLGVEPKNESIQSLADELDRLNAELAKKQARRYFATSKQKTRHDYPTFFCDCGSRSNSKKRTISHSFDVCLHDCVTDNFV